MYEREEKRIWKDISSNYVQHKAHNTLQGQCAIAILLIRAMY